jgi:hypothetical protein
LLNRDRVKPARQLDKLITVQRLKDGAVDPGQVESGLLYGPIESDPSALAKPLQSQNTLKFIEESIRRAQPPGS